MSFKIKQKVALRRYTRAARRKYTVEREEMLEVLENMDGHFTAVELINAAKGKAIHANSTIYRNLHVLVDAGFINEIRLADGKTVYERNDGRRHHDHLICVGCNKVIGLSESKEISALHKALAQKHNFDLVSYVHNIKGYCKECMKRVNAPRAH